ncbi:MAG: hypothetical protein NWQ55_05770 [Salibacteraceae bacterium]|jgi:uncharacterized membrane protein YphA (DoxX/SURF4 family)|nr:hypothetical protein [Salibacteraceae bacterium]
MKWLQLSLRLFYGLLFVASAIAKLFPVESFELILIKQVGISWHWVAYFSRGLIFLEFALGLAIITGFQLRKSILASLGLLGAFSVYLMIQITSGAGDENCGCFGELIPLDAIQSLIKNAFFAVFAVLLLFISNRKSEHKTAVAFPMLAYGALIYLLFQSPFPKTLGEEIGNNSITPFEELATTNKIDLGQKQLFLVMFAECKHCEQLASTISAMNFDAEKSHLNVLVYGHPKRVEEFAELTNIQHLNPQATKDRNILAAIDGTFPTMVMIDSSEIKHLWVGAALNTRLFSQYLVP